MTLKDKIVMPTVVLLSAFAVTFFAYGGGRTMVETVGTSQRAITNGLIITALANVGLIVFFWFFLMFKKPAYIHRVLPWAVAALVLGIIGGAITSEMLILRDENNFPAEARAAIAKPGEDGELLETYSRSRAWPNGSGQLHYTENSGMWATD